jgi:hypothetical protein
MITNLYRSCKTRLVNSRPTLTRNSVVKIETTSLNLEEADSLNLNFQEYQEDTMSLVNQIQGVANH